jgi:Flp pilus assembly pilin Flp
MYSMLPKIRSLWRSICIDETAQGLAEYCLVTALLALVALGIFIHVSGGMQNIWGAAGSTIANAGSTAAGGDATASAPGGH